MDKKTMSEGVAVCPACNAANRLTVDAALPGSTEIHCSRCGTRIGIWADVMLDPAAKPSQED